MTADVSALDYSSARIGANVIEREVKDLPLNGRQLSQLYLQAPGSVNSGTGTFGDIRFSGRAVEQNIVRYDGVEGTAIIDASPGNLNGEIPSPFRLQSSLENVQEFRVESSNYPAEYGTGRAGRSASSARSAAMRSTDPPSNTSAAKTSTRRNYFDLAKSPLKLNQFGGSVGGPIVKDATFVFGSYEGYRLMPASTSSRRRRARWRSRAPSEPIQPLYRRLPWPRRGRARRQVDEPRLRHRCSCRACRRSRKTRSTCGSTRS